MLLSMNANIRSIPRLEKLGYEAIDVGFCGTIYEGDRHDPVLDSENWQDVIADHKEKSVLHNVLIKSSHLPYLYDYTKIDEDPECRRKYEMTCRALVASDLLGAKWAVMHIKDVEATTAFVRRLFADTGVENVGIAIENSHKVPLEVLMETHDVLKNEGYRVGICLDLGHCHMNKVQDLDVVESIHRLGDRLCMLHVHDNCRNLDYHGEPFCGTIPWIEVMKALKEISYSGDFNYEIKIGKIPTPLRPIYEQYCAEIGRYLISVYNDHSPEEIQ